MFFKKMFKEYDTVKIRALKESSREFDGTESVSRPPQIGDEGSIVHILGLEGGEVKYVVEAVNTDGETIWVADFLESELYKLRERGNNGNYVCPCCGYATLSEFSSYEICEICFWEDDGQDDPEADVCWGGPNWVSLTEGRKNFLLFGVSDPKDKKHVRAPSKTDEQVRIFTIKNDNVKK